jgi:hypothetical protein
MALTPSNTIREELKLLGNAIVGLLGVGVVLGFENRVPFPQGNFVTLSVIREERQSTNETYYPTRVAPAVNQCDRSDLLFSTLVVQLDCYGVNAHATANGVLMLCRSDLMDRYGVTPLFSTDPINMPFDDAENQQAQRWTLDANLQFNTSWTQTQDSATVIDFTIFHEADKQPTAPI